jgi:hypothetical protein
LLHICILCDLSIFFGPVLQLESTEPTNQSYKARVNRANEPELQSQCRVIRNLFITVLHQLLYFSVLSRRIVCTSIVHYYVLHTDQIWKFMGQKWILFGSEYFVSIIFQYFLLRRTQNHLWLYVPLLYWIKSSYFEQLVITAIYFHIIW